MGNRFLLPRALRPGILMTFLVVGLACNDLLDVNDPDQIQKEDLRGVQGADLIWGGGIRVFSEAFCGHGQSHVVIAGLMTDESHDVAVDPDLRNFDRRDSGPTSWVIENIFTVLHRARSSTRNAAEFLDEVVPEDPRVGEMWNLNGYTYLWLGEDFCSGVTFSHITLDGAVTPGEPKTTAETFAVALSRFETALAEANGETQQTYLARVGMGRALLNLDRFAEAAAAVGSVPTEWKYAMHYGTAFWNQHQSWAAAGRVSISDNEGGNGLPFRSANDPRVPWDERGKGTDGQSDHFAQLKFPDRDSPVTLASGLEARFIEAEAALEQGDVDGFLSHLNEVREALDMDPVSDPGTPDSRVDLLFYERGFTLFGEGHRLGDFRRLVRQYGRDPKSVFPTGDYHKPGLSYGTDMNLILQDSERENPHFVGCFDRGA